MGYRNEKWELARIVPYARNARKHPPEQLAKLAASVQEWGQTSLLLVDEDGVLIAGHGRLEALRSLGVEQVEVRIVDGWSEAKKRAYRIADNALPNHAEDDLDLLRLEVEDLELAGFDLGLLGLDLDALALDDEKELKDLSSQVSEIFEVSVTCKDESEQSQVYQWLTEKGLKCRILSM